MNVEQVVESFCKHFNVEGSIVFSKNNDRAIIELRYLLYKVLREECGLSSYKLVPMFKRSRRNIMRGLSIVSTHLDLYNDFRDKYDAFIEKIRESR